MSLGKESYNKHSPAFIHGHICKKGILQNSKNSSDNIIEFGQYLDQEYAIIEPSKQPKFIKLPFLMQLFKQSDHCHCNMFYCLCDLLTTNNSESYLLYFYFGINV